MLGVAVYDRATGKSELIAQVKDSIGELHPPNVIIYPDAFSSDTGASGEPGSAAGYALIKPDVAPSGNTVDIVDESRSKNVADEVSTSRLPMSH